MPLIEKVWLRSTKQSIRCFMSSLALVCNQYIICIATSLREQNNI